MKLKMKATVAALAMMAAGGANAAINPGTPATPGQGELFFSVWDSINKISYSRDLGVTINQFLVSPSASMSFAADAKLQSFISTANASGSSLVWNLLGSYDSLLANPAEMQPYGLYMTSNSTNAKLSAIDYGQIGNALSDISTFTNGINNDAIAQGGGSISNYALNNASTSIVGSGGYYGGAYGGGQLGTQIGASGASDEAAIGQSMGFYQIGLQLDATGNPIGTPDGMSLVTQVTKFGNWTLAANGDLSYGVAGAPAPVPLPPAVLLLGSALAGLVGVARRNRSQEETLTA